METFHVVTDDKQQNWSFGHSPGTHAGGGGDGGGVATTAFVHADNELTRLSAFIGTAEGKYGLGVAGS